MIEALCVGAHPDDVELGMGATVAGMVRMGMSVAIVDLTDGEPTPHGTPEKRAREAAAAAAELGVERRTLDLANRELADTVEARTALAEVIRDLAPRLIFAPYPVDAHPDHVAASAIAEAARFYGRFVKTTMSGEPHRAERLYRYQAVHLRLLSKPAFIVDVTDDLPAKLRALGCYESQFAANAANASVIEDARRGAERWGSLIGRSAGEPFFSDEEIGVTSIADLV